MSLSNDSTVMTMPVAPVYQGNNCGFGNGWGGDWMSWLLLFVLFGGWGYGGFGGGFGGGYGGFNTPNAQGVITRADLNDGFALNGLQNNQTSIKDAVTNGFHGVDNAVRNLGYQLQDCCCQTQSAIQGVRYDIATSAAATQNTIQNTTRDIIDNQTSGINAIMGKLSQMEYNGLNDKYQAALAENQALKFQASQTAQNAFITANQEAQTAELLRRLGRDCPVPAYWVNPPTPVPVPCGTCNTCGC